MEGAQESGVWSLRLKENQKRADSMTNLMYGLYLFQISEVA